MAPVRTANGCDFRRMARSGQPVVDCGSDLAALDRWFTGTVMASNQKHDPLAARDCLIKATVYRTPGAVEVHAVKVEHSVRLDRAIAKALVPSAIQGIADRWPEWRNRS